MKGLTFSQLFLHNDVSIVHSPLEFGNGKMMIAFFIDIDGTIVFDGQRRQIGEKYPLGNAIFEIIHAAMVERGMKSEIASAKLKSYAEQHVFWDYPDFIQAFNLPEQQIGQRITDWHNANLSVHPDAVQAITALHAKGHRLFIISNNPYTGCLLKLQRAGLGNGRNSPFFEDIFSSDRLRGQKSSPAYWREAIRRSGIPPENIAVIGDHPDEDGRIPKNAGIGHIFLIDRRQKSPATIRNGAILINDIRQVLDWSFKT